ncbi:hypothetical protein EUTSA_v10028002mg [Eutrema salsugineum]|uniref:TF-B3 domain-containing protein n=1 Tax=Eutrema salsugineum TaxID=72664 RepID=V4M4X8_EUTSA|nr:hypothetical protein EUTSA_v10028002mg [Eutrema salsugineum]
MCLQKKRRIWNLCYLPKNISRSNILTGRFDEIILMDKHGRKWTSGLYCRKSSGEVYITRVWRSFCEANGQKVGCSFVFKLVSNRTSPLLIMTSEETT